VLGGDTIAISKGHGVNWERGFAFTQSDNDVEDHFLAHVGGIGNREFRKWSGLGRLRGDWRY